MCLMFLLQSVQTQTYTYGECTSDRSTMTAINARAQSVRFFFLSFFFAHKFFVATYDTSSLTTPNTTSTHTTQTFRWLSIWFWFSIWFPLACRRLVRDVMRQKTVTIDQRNGFNVRANEWKISSAFTIASGLFIFNPFYCIWVVILILFRLNKFHFLSNATEWGDGVAPNGSQSLRIKIKCSTHLLAEKI